MSKFRIEVGVQREVKIDPLKVDGRRVSRVAVSHHVLVTDEDYNAVANFELSSDQLMNLLTGGSTVIEAGV